MFPLSQRERGKQRIVFSSWAGNYSEIKNGAGVFCHKRQRHTGPVVVTAYLPSLALIAAITASLDVAFTRTNMPSFS